MPKVASKNENAARVETALVDGREITIIRSGASGTVRLEELHLVKDTVVYGNLEVDGGIDGENSSLVVHGDMYAGNIYVAEAIVEGNVFCEGLAEARGEFYAYGNISAWLLKAREISGRNLNANVGIRALWNVHANGNITTDTPPMLKSIVSEYGDIIATGNLESNGDVLAAKGIIKAKSITVKEGAVLADWIYSDGDIIVKGVLESYGGIYSAGNVSAARDIVAGMDIVAQNISAETVLVGEKNKEQGYIEAEGIEAGLVVAKTISTPRIKAADVFCDGMLRGSIQPTGSFERYFAKDIEEQYKILEEWYNTLKSLERD